MSIQDAIAKNLAQILDETTSQKSTVSPSPTFQQQASQQPKAAPTELLLETQHELIAQFESRISNLTQQSQELHLDIELFNSADRNRQDSNGCLELNSVQLSNKAKSLENQIAKLKTDLESKHFLRFNDQNLNIELATQWEELQAKQQSLANALEQSGRSKLLSADIISQMLELEMAKVQLRSDYQEAQEELVQTTQIAMDNIRLSNYQAAQVECSKLRELQSQKFNTLFSQHQSAIAEGSDKNLFLDNSARICSQQDIGLNKRLLQHIVDLDKVGQLLLTNVKKRLPGNSAFISIVEKDLGLTQQVASITKAWLEQCANENVSLAELQQRRIDRSKLAILFNSLFSSSLSPVERWTKSLTQIAEKQGLSADNQNWLTTAINALQRNSDADRREFVSLISAIQVSKQSWTEMEQKQTLSSRNRETQDQQLERLCSEQTVQLLKDRSQLLNNFRLKSENEIKRLQQRSDECQKRNQSNLSIRLKELGDKQNTLLYHLNDQTPSVIPTRSAEYQRFSRHFQELQSTNHRMFEISSEQNRLKQTQQRVKSLQNTFAHLAQLAHNNAELMHFNLHSIAAKTSTTIPKLYFDLDIEIDQIQTIDDKLEDVPYVTAILTIGEDRKSLVLPVDNDSSEPIAKLTFTHVMRSSMLKLTLERPEAGEKGKLLGSYSFALEGIDEERTWVEFPIESSLSDTNLLEPVMRLKIN